ncbi:MAG: hypothetical protein HQK51_01740, partial [Oligoflexia bacterium]|nr:hypothetical protein [Oligoflexia bacterium]
MRSYSFKILILFLLNFPLSTSTSTSMIFANDNNNNNENKEIEEIVLSNKQDVEKYISIIDKLDAQELPLKISFFHKAIDNYLLNKLRVCSGEFSKLFFLDKEKNFLTTEKKILSSDEKKNCFEELKELENRFTEVQFTV